MIKKRKVFFFERNAGNNKTYAKTMFKDAIDSGLMEFEYVPSVISKKIIGLEKIFPDGIWSQLEKCYIDGYLSGGKRKYQNSIMCFNEDQDIIQRRGAIAYIKEKYKSYAVLVMRNPIPNKLYPSVVASKTKSRLLEDVKKEFDLIVTDEKIDADLFGLLYLPDCFSNPFKCKPEVDCDLVFIGADKGRKDIIKDVFIKAKENHVSVNFMVVGGRDSFGIKNIDWLDYKKVIYADMKANCILEILQPGQESFTLRYQEAICLKKKLLTNNINVLNEDFYNPKYIQVFTDVNKIDWDFVRNREKVNYKYDGRYSPIWFIDRITDGLEDVIEERGIK